MKRACLIISLLFVISLSLFGQYAIPGAAEQPKFLFPIWFEDGTGARDTIYFGFDDDATQLYDAQYNEWQGIDTSQFNVLINSGAYSPFLTNPVDSAYKAIISLGNSGFNLTNFPLSMNKGVYPLTIYWDNSLFYSDSLDQIPLISGEPKFRIDFECYSIDLFCGFADAFKSLCPQEVTAFDCIETITADSLTIEGWVNYPLDFSIGMSVNLFNNPVNIENIGLENKIKVYPNPTSSLLHISCDKSIITKVELFDINGRILFEERNPVDSEKTLYLDNLNPGQYLLRVESNDIFYSEKVLVQ